MQGHPRRLDHSGEFCQNMPTGRGNGKQLQYSCHENSMSSMRVEKDRTLKDESFRLEGVQHATGEEQRTITNSSRKKEVAEPKC